MSSLIHKIYTVNGPVIFVPKLHRHHTFGNCVIVSVEHLSKLDLLNYRGALPLEIALVVVSPEPEAAIREVFDGYELVEAAGGIVKRKKKYLFIERFGKWDLPKGKIEPGEGSGEAAIREIEEECGISRVQIDGLLGFTYHTHNHYGTPTLKRNWWYAMSYDGPKRLVPQSEEDITQAVWLKKADFGIVEQNTYPSIRDVLSMLKDW